MDIAVHRWRQRVVAPEDVEDWRRRLEALVRGPLRQRLDALPDPGGMVFVRALHLRLRLPGVVADEALADAWVHALTANLDARVGGESVVAFRDRPSAELAALEARLLASGVGRGGVDPGADPSIAGWGLAGAGAEPWWVEAALRGRGAARILSAWLSTEPIRVPQALVHLGAGQPARLARLLHPDDAATLIEGLTAVWSGAAPPPVADLAPEGRTEPVHLALLHAAEARLPRSEVSGRAEAPSPSAPSQGETPHPDVAPPHAGPGAPLRSPAARDPHPIVAPRPASPAPGPKARVPDATLPIPAAPAPAPALPGQYPLALGGLLFLLRPLSRHPWLADRPWSAWPAALAAVVRHLDERLLGDLPAAERAAVLDAHASLCGVFAVTWPPGDDDPGARAEAARVIDRLIGDLGEDLLDCRDSLPPWVRRLPPGDEALRRVILRPARLAVTPTHADLTLPMDTVDVVLRRSGWDLDPGWLPGLRRVVRFHYEGRG